MIRLSKRGWNNVIIIVVLFLIVLFNYSHKLVSDNAANSNEDSVLLPSYSEINQIDFGTHQLQRIGLGWRMQPGLAISEAELAEVVGHWSAATGNIIPWADIQQAYVVSIQLAGEEQARVFKVRAQGQDLLIQHRQQLFLLSNHALSDFIPLPLQ